VSAKASHAVTSRYALALIELAQESNKIQQVERDLNELASMIVASSDLATVIFSPSLSSDQQFKAIMAIADKAKFEGLTRNFLGVLVKNRRLGVIQGITDAFRTELSRRRGEVAVEVQTAQDMSASQFEVGGMIVTIGSKMIDDSVARKLERLKAAMSRQSNQNIQTVKEVG
jgi:F-type H+-transporting ATPase subunit delta